MTGARAAEVPGIGPLTCEICFEHPTMDAAMPIPRANHLRWGNLMCSSSSLKGKSLCALYRRARPNRRNGSRARQGKEKPRGFSRDGGDLFIAGDGPCASEACLDWSANERKEDRVAALSSACGQASPRKLGALQGGSRAPIGWPRATSRRTLFTLRLRRRDRSSIAHAPNPAR